MAAHAGPRYDPVPIVVLAASAGGVEALFELFEALPATTGLAFVVVVHQPAREPSLLAELIARHTSMHCCEVTSATRIVADAVFVAPARGALTLAGEILDVVAAPDASARHAIDDAFLAIAHERRERTIGIVLSGTGSDGSRGIAAIEAVSGCVMAQSELSARYSEMPRSAIATNLVDVVGTPTELARRVVDYASAAFTPIARSDGTAFFRDRDGFAELERSVIPELFVAKASDEAVRVWTIGCANGEDAYSLAMLLHEHRERLQLTNPLQVFATDRDPVAIAIGRRGIYPATAVEDLGPERAERFFLRVGDALQVRRELRDCVVFASHDLVGSPPFVRLDLITCRTALAELEESVRARMLRRMYRALRPGGFLWLDASASFGDARQFRVIGEDGALRQRGELAAAETASSSPAIASRIDAATARIQSQLAQLFAPPCVVVDETGTISYVHGRTGAFLEAAPGPQSQANVLAMARVGLQPELGRALREAARAGLRVIRRRVDVGVDGGRIPVQLSVRALPNAPGRARDFLIVFDRARELDALVDGASTDHAERIEALAAELERERARTEASLQDYEVANEELQSMNEQLRVVNEQLETSREELHSLNEELHSVNAEMLARMDAASRSDRELQSLLVASDVALVLVDAELRLRRFTEPVRRFFRLIPADIGRPFAELLPAEASARLLALMREAASDTTPHTIEISPGAQTWRVRASSCALAVDERPGVALSFELA